jgi:NAD(P)-dependent dehydrogenase (short-subunit alcohol dehydrogenase family)
MRGKTVVITGGTSGIGEVAAVRLAEKGARIVFVARDKTRAETTLAKLALANPGVVHSFHIADLFSLAEMKRVAAEIAAAEPAIDVLINNAGGLFEKRQVTVDGLERTFALNHMAYFVITNGLLKTLKPGARIVSTASDAHLAARLDFDDLQFEHGFKGFRVYGTSKLCNILFTRELARRLEGTGITAVCLHPGFVATRFATNNNGWLGMAFAVLKKLAAISPEKGARTIVHLASVPGIDCNGGTYWYKCKPIAPSRAARNAADAKRLWEISEQIANG